MTKRKRARNRPPKGSYSLPGGGHALDRSYVTKNGRRITVTAKLKAEPDTEKLALVVIEIAKQLAEEERRRKRRP